MLDNPNFAKDRMECIQAAMIDKRLTHLDCRVLVLIATKYLNRAKGYAYPSIARLAQDIGVADRSVQRSVRHLEEYGYLEVSSGGGRRRSNHYSVKIPAEPRPQSHPFGPQKGDSRKSNKVTPGSDKPRHQCHPNPMTEPSEIRTPYKDL